MKKVYSFKSKVWLYTGNAGWHFVTLPKKLAEEIDSYFHSKKRGWGSLPVEVTVNKTSWKTSIFPDRESQSYVLPLKAQIRKKENVKEGDTVNFSLEILA